MRIGLFSDTYSPEINGVVSSILTLQRKLEKEGHEVFIVTNHKAFINTQQEGNILRLPGLELKWLYGYKLSTPYHFSAKEIVRNMNLDVIHVHTEFGVGLFGRIVGRSLNIPVISTYHTMYEDYTHYINRFAIDEIDSLGKKFVSSFSRMLLDNVQAVIAPSEKTKEVLLKYGVQTPIYTIPTGLEFDMFDANNIDREEISKLRKQYEIQDDERIVVYVGRIAKEKSIDVPIRSFQYIKDRNIKLMIVGDGPELPVLKDLVNTLQLQECIIFTGAKKREEVPLFYAMADAFVSASITETQGMTYIEAMASSLPVFARPDEVVQDLVKEGETGYFFKDEQELAQKLEQYFSLHDAQRKTLADNAKSMVSKYDVNIFYAKVISVYYQAIDDYEHSYEVLRIKAYDDYMKLYIQNDKEDEPKKLKISLEDYFTLKIQKGILLDRHTISKLQEKEQSYDAYQLCLRKLKIRDYTKKELCEYLKYQKNFSQAIIDPVITELEERNYINDDNYLTMQIDKMQYSLQSKGKIIKKLVDKGIPYEKIKLAMADIDDESESKKAFKLAEKLKNSLHDKSASMKRKLIAQKLMLQGYEYHIARHVSEEIELEEEADALKKTIEKGIRQYSRKYESNDLKKKVVQYCMRKGFTMDQIMNEIDEMEW